jgi:starch synthase (maltosyl-transferring)
MVSRRPPSLARLTIERVLPSLDAGRYAVKRVVGDRVQVSADIFKDGHELLDARLMFRGPNDAEWRSAPFTYSFDDDRFFGEFELDAMGRWEYAIEAWPDTFRTWREDLKKRRDAGQDLASELLEGAILIAQRMAWLHDAPPILARARDVLDDRAASVEQRLAAAFDQDLALAMVGPIHPEQMGRHPSLELYADRRRALFGSWYEVFPRSAGNVPGQHGTFRDLAARVPDFAELGFDVLYLPPIHPIGQTHRKGKNNSPTSQPGEVGSPWAIGSAEGGHMAIHPQLGSLEDFRSLLKRARKEGIEIALDYALQCSPDHPWIREHPEWFFVRPDGSLRHAENPPKKYEDIYPLNFWCDERESLWIACRDVVLYWATQGVRIFRVDNPHTKPFMFWEWLIREVQRRNPDVIFLAEAFTRPKRMQNLAKLGFTQSYTYFTWKNEAREIKPYLEELTQSEMVEYFRPNFFANTPDILHEYLQHGGRPAFRVRLLLAATLSPTYGIYSGFELCENVPVRPGSEEYLDSEKYEVRVRDWHAPGNIRADVKLINRIRREQAALQRLSNLRFLPSENERILAYAKDNLWIVVNLDPHHTQESMIHVPGSGHYLVEDLLTGESYPWHGSRNYVRLDPAEKVGHVFRVVE